MTNTEEFLEASCREEKQRQSGSLLPWGPGAGEAGGSWCRGGQKQEQEGEQGEQEQEIRDINMKISRRRGSDQDQDQREYENSRTSINRSKWNFDRVKN